MKPVSDNVSKYISELTEECPECLKITHYLSKHHEADINQIQQEFDKDPQKYLDILEDKELVYKEDNTDNYLLTDVGKMVATSIEIKIQRLDKDTIH